MDPQLLLVQCDVELACACAHGLRARLQAVVDVGIVVAALAGRRRERADRRLAHRAQRVVGEEQRVALLVVGLLEPLVQPLELRLVDVALLEARSRGPRSKW